MMSTPVMTRCQNEFTFEQVGAVVDGRQDEGAEQGSVH